MERLGSIFDRYVSTVLALALLFMFIMIFLNVVLRFIFSSGVPVAEELARFAFLWTTFLGAYLAVREDQHIGITGLRGMVNEKYHWIFKLVTNAIKVVILAVVIVGAWDILMSNLGGRAPVSGVPVAIGFTSVVVGAAVLFATFTYRLYAVIKEHTGGDDQ